MLKRDIEGVEMKLVIMSMLLSLSLFAGGDILPVEEITLFEKMDSSYVNESNVLSNEVIEENSYTNENYADVGNVEENYVENSYVEENSYTNENYIYESNVEDENVDNNYLNQSNNESVYTSNNNYVEASDVANSFKPTIINKCVTTCGEVAELLPYYGEDIPDAMTFPCFAENSVVGDY